VGYHSSADYFHIDAALKSLWQPFNELVIEMDTFAPRPQSDFDDKRKELLKHFKDLNPHQSEESLGKLVDGMISVESDERNQFSDHFTDRFMTHYIMVAFLSHALCEATINAILAIGLANNGAEEFFKLVEKADIKEKWRIGPKCFCPSYELHPGTGIFETLNHLTKRRNALVHNKINLHVNGKKVLEGSKFERISFQENIRWMRRFFSLPYDLEALAQANIKEPLMILPGSSPIITAEAHRKR
jgi:hypothetical protein